MSKSLNRAENIGRRHGPFRRGVSSPEHVVASMDRRLGLKLDLTPKLKGEFLNKLSFAAISNRGLPSKIDGIINGDVLVLPRLNRHLKRLGFQVDKIDRAYRLHKTSPSGKGGMFFGAVAPAMATTQGLLVPLRESAPEALKPENNKPMISLFQKQDTNGGNGNLKRIQADVISIIKQFVEMSGPGVQLTRNDIAQQYRVFKKSDLRAEELDRVLASLEQLMLIKDVGGGRYEIFNQAQEILEITTIFMTEAGKEENKNLYNLVSLFVSLLNRVYVNVDFYLYRDRDHNEFLLLERTTGKKETSQYYPHWNRAGRTRDQINKDYLKKRQILREVNPETDLDFTDPQSRQNDSSIFIDPSGSFLSGILSVGEGKKTTILGAANFSNWAPRHEYDHNGRTNSIIGDEVNPPLYGPWVQDKSAVNSALVNLFNQMAIKMDLLLRESGFKDIKTLWEHAMDVREQWELDDRRPDSIGLKALLREFPGVASKKTFRSREGERSIPVQIKSIKNPLTSLVKEDAADLAAMLKIASLDAWRGKKGIDIQGYSNRFVLDHFLGVQKLMVAVDRKAFGLIGFAGLNKKNLSVETQAGDRVSRIMHIVESVMIMADYQEYNIGPHLMYKLLAEALLEHEATSEEGELMKISLRTANPRAYGAIWRAFGDRLYPNPDREFVDTEKLSAEEHEMIKLLEAVSEHINPDNKFDPATGVVKGVYSEDDGMRLASENIQWDRDPRVNEFVAKLLRFDPEGGNVEGNALILFIEADRETRRQYESAKGIGSWTQTMKDWALGKWLNLGRRFA